MKYNMTKGATVKIQSTIYTDDSITPANLAGSTIKFMLKKNASDTDTAKLLEKSVGSGITVLSAADGTIETLIDATDTNALSYNKVFFEILVKLSNNTYIRSGVEELVLEGNIVNTLI